MFAVDLSIHNKASDDAAPAVADADTLLRLNSAEQPLALWNIANPMKKLLCMHKYNLYFIL